ncbi:unnamed protein product, partial [marine sediment metagenome]
NIDEAIALWKQAADRDHPRANYELSQCYRHGDGVKADHSRYL